MSAIRIAANRLRTTQILSVEAQGPAVKTYTFKDEECAKAKPGQFLMLWIPGVDEIPFSILDADDRGKVSVVVKKVGEATEALHSKKTGETVGIRGPFGSSFTMKEGRILMVGGGTGIAPLLFLTKKLASRKAEILFVIGAKTKMELLFLDRLEELCSKRNVVATTEDGSYGIKCLATAPLESLLAKKRFDIVYTCGPEQMMLKILDLAEKRGIALEASLERLMRCAIGLCGSCVIGKYRVCRDGPVLTATQLKEVKSEFGISKRDFNGRSIPI